MFAISRLQGPKIKLGSGSRERKIQFSGPALRSFANLYIALEQDCCSLSASEACIWNIRPGNKIPFYRKILITLPEVYTYSKDLKNFAG